MPTLEVFTSGLGSLLGDFFVVLTAIFRLLYVFVVLDVGTRRIRPWNVTAHPTPDSTAQQFRMISTGHLFDRVIIRSNRVSPGCVARREHASRVLVARERSSACSYL
jgi:hypothetical protein